MILVTGAAGKTGQAVFKALATKSAPVRAFIRHNGSLLQRRCRFLAHRVISRQRSRRSLLGA